MTTPSLLRLRARRPECERCPLCRGALREEAWTTCHRCDTAHHAACFFQLGGCATLGCPERGHAPRPLRSRWNRRRTPSLSGILGSVRTVVAFGTGLGAGICLTIGGIVTLFLL